MVKISNTLLKLKQQYYSKRIRQVLLKTKLLSLIKSLYYTLYRQSLNKIRSESVLGHTMKFHQISEVEQHQINTSLDETSIIKRIIECCRPNDTVFDVGGNIGVHACLIQKNMETSTSAKVVSFEPHPNNVRRLHQNAKLNQVDLRVEQVALFDQEGTMTLHSVSEKPGEGKHALKTNEDSDLEEIEVETIPGDKYIKRENLPTPNVIKIDVEGAEYQVLRGLSETLERDDCRSVFVEVHRTKLSAFDSSTEKIEYLLREKGFEIRQIRDRESEYFIEATKPDSNNK